MKLMKIFKIYPLLLSALFLIVVTSCNEEDRDTTFIDGILVPTNITLNVDVTQDNTGLATLTPSGDSVSSFTINFGDDSEIVTVLPGESVTHTYVEGVYQAIVTGINLNGDSTSIMKEVVVSFLPPENLEIMISPISGDAFSIDLSATAENAVGFEVYFGEMQNEIPTPLMLNETLQYTYETTGTYIIRVVALAGGAATIEGTEEVIIINPIILPIDFESSTIEYSFIDFGGATTTLIVNPDTSGINTSANVAEFFKETGAEVFAGTVIELGAAIDFSEFQGFSLKSWSPLIGATVKLKLENASDNSISAEIDAVTTVANSWETLVFDFSDQDLTQEYSKVIVFFDFDLPGAGDTFYFDDIEQSSGGVIFPDVQFPLTFEDSSLMYDFVGFEGADSAIESNPFITGENTSATVMRTIKTMGALFYAGTAINLDIAIDFSTSEMISFKSYSPKAGIPVKLRLENADNSIGIEVDVNTTVINQWETLTYDFSGQTTGTEFVRVVVFYEFIVDLAGDGSTYYFDDVQIAN